jgi:glyoxylase-like metal-dependent hydrolase (beta-lactamase superfamily II)
MRGHLTALTVSMACLAVAGTGSQQAVPAPQIPQPVFRAPEDTRKTGVKPGEIRAGVRPDYTALREHLTVIPVQGRIHLIGGAGSNIAVQTSDEGTLIVDTGDAAAADKVIAAVGTLQVRPVRWIINTTADLDHTGGNGKIAKFGSNNLAGAAAPGAGNIEFNGSGAGIIAFQRVLDRMSAPTGQRAARDIDAWPTDTFLTARKNFWYGGEPIEMWHRPAAHGDADVIVFFRKSDVIVAGDVIAVDRYPYIDAQNGGSIDGIIDALNWIVATAVPEYNQQGGTRIIPGHGRVLNQSDVVEYRDMATIVRDRIAALAGKGNTLAQIKSMHPTLDYDGNYGSTTGPWTTEMFIDEVYREVTARRAPAPSSSASPARPAASTPRPSKTAPARPPGK